MVDTDDVCVLIPTLEEEETIGDVIEGFQELGFDSILVVDGHSSDDTRSIADAAGAEVFEQTGTGKGRAVREAFDRIEKDIVILVDGDGTYRPADAPKLIEPIRNGTHDHVIGNRFADLHPGAMSRFNRFGNWLINRSFAVIHGRDLSDILSGYRAFTLESTTTLPLTATGFGIETEFSVECVRNGIPTTVVPITYRPRPSASSTNLRPVRDGAIIILTLYRLARWNNPLFYFGSLGILSGLLGLSLGGFIAYDWFINSISHDVLAVVAAFLILFGLQLLMFGLLSDLIVTLHREQRRLVERVTDDKDP